MLSHHWTEMLDDFVVTTSRSGWREVTRHLVNVPWLAGHDTGGKKSSSGQQRWGKHGVAAPQCAHESHTPIKMTSPLPSDSCANSIIASCMNFSHLSGGFDPNFEVMCLFMCHSPLSPRHPKRHSEMLGLECWRRLTLKVLNPVGRCLLDPSFSRLKVLWSSVCTWILRRLKVNCGMMVFRLFWNLYRLDKRFSVIFESPTQWITGRLRPAGPASLESRASGMMSISEMRIWSGE